MISIGSTWAMDGLAIIYVGTLLLLSNLTYRYIEVPWRDHFNRLAGRMPPQNAAHALG
jgi:peptidoglycan/LPS O-acetylase OafA/YrhL